MSEISILSPHVADLIAAGEVVERPASVIKELLENAFDAGAKNITVELKNGGMTYIRVTDDGCGMLPEDAGMCFMRHATSKLRDERGLENISTMGFRGEALAAIASVSRIELQSRKKGENIGTRVVLEAGEITQMTQHGCPEGTTMIVRDLFFNTPARLKFMKSDRSEGSACVSAALRCALGRPDISVRFVKDGEDEFFSPGDGKISSCAYSLLGRETALNFLECKGDVDDISIMGFVGSPKFAYGNRAKQFFFCNGRCIKSQLLQAAVEQAYKNTILTSRYPSCVIYLSISPAKVDVNVHPAKIEVKFCDERKVFDLIYYAVLSALNGKSSFDDTSLSNPTSDVSIQDKYFLKSIDTNYPIKKNDNKLNSVNFPELVKTSEKALKNQNTEPVPEKGLLTWNRNAAYETSSSLKVRESDSPYKISDNKKASFNPNCHSVINEEKFTLDREKNCKENCTDEIIDNSENSQKHMLPDENDFRLIGEAMKTYILVEKDNELLLIDKHAAHERMIFNRLKGQGYEIMSQALIAPITVKLTAEDIELVENSSDILTSLGFEIEPFGIDSIILRGVPEGTDVSDASAMIEEIFEKLKKNAQLSPSDITDDILHTISCKAAIKSGCATACEELLVIAKEVVSGNIKYCPHGRPVSVTLTKKQLDKEFLRIV